MSDSGADHEGFRINSQFADSYNKYRRKEELQKFKDKYGDVSEQDESSSSSSEDENAEALTPQIERDWLRALSAIKNKDPKIYDSSTRFFSHDSTSKSSSGDESLDIPKKKKKIFLKDYERQILIEKGPELSTDDSEEEYRLKEQAPGYYEEQEQIRASFKDALLDSDAEDDLFVPRTKSLTQKREEDEDYLQWVKSDDGKIESQEVTGVKQELDPLRKYWTKPSLDDSEKFIRNFILDKKYIAPDSDRIPTYDEIIHDENFSEDEETVERQETFEMKYNFRFEEPDAEFIKSFPRTVSGSVRPKDSKRSAKRQTIKDRKQREKEEKHVELQQIKKMKRDEIQERIKMLEQVTGNKDLGLTFEDKDLDGDFDPKEYDQLMKKTFSNDYYDIEGDDSKPVFPEDPLIDDTENWDEWVGEDIDTQHTEPHCEDPGFIMDVDYDPNLIPVRKQPDIQFKKRKKKKSKFAQAVEKEKPVFDPEGKSFEQYLDEYYKLDYEDIIDDQPCRFKYRPVTANQFGLSTKEILYSRDEELNAWASLKKITQYRANDEEMKDLKVYRKKGEDQRKKLNIIHSLRNLQEETNKLDNDKQSKKKRKKKKRKVTPDTNTGNKTSQSGMSTGEIKHHDGSEKKGGKKRKRPKSKAQSAGQTQAVKSIKIESKSTNEERKDTPATKQAAAGRRQKKNKRRNPTAKKSIISDDRLKAYGIDPRKFKFSYLPKLTKKT